MIVSFPWPHRNLSPNARAHWAEKAKRAKAYRTGVAWEAQAAGLRAIEAERVHVAVEFMPPDRRARDLDNMLATIKPGLDGIADVIGVDDSKWTLAIKRGDPVKRGRVVVCIEKEE